MKNVALMGLEKAVNAYLKLDPETVKKLAFLNNKVVLFTINDWNISFYIMFHLHCVECVADYSGEVTAGIQGNLIDLVKVSLARGKQTVLFKSGVSSTGDVEVVQAVRDLFAQMDIDWEEHLSHIVGDVAAHQMGSVARQVSQEMKTVSSKIGNNIAEYLQHELKLLPSRVEIDAFINDVSVIRNDVERAEARLKKIVKNDH